MSDSELKAIWLALGELQGRLLMLEQHKHRHIDENRAALKELVELRKIEDKINSICSKDVYEASHGLATP